MHEALEPLRNASVTKMRELWKVGVDVIYLSGGGAPLVEKAVTSASAGQVQVVENVLNANVCGYLNFAAFRVAQGIGV